MRLSVHSLFTGLCLVAHFSFAQLKSADLRRVHEMILMGDLNKAQSKAESAYNNLYKKKNSGETYSRIDYVYTQLLQARIAYAFARYPRVKQLMFTVDADVQKLLNKTGEEYLWGLYYEAEAYTEMQNTAKSDELLKQAENYENVIYKISPELRDKITALQALNLVKQGFANEALKKINQSLETKAGFMDRRSYTPEGTKLSKISKKDYKLLKSDFAALINASGQAYYFKGNYHSADSAYQLASGWVKSNLGRKHYRRAENYFGLAEVAETGNLNVYKSIGYYQRAYKTRRKGLFSSKYRPRKRSEQMILALENIGRNYSTIDKPDRTGSAIYHIRNILKKYYGADNNLYQYYDKRTGALKYLSRKYSPDAQKLLVETLKDTFRLPRGEYRRLAILDMIYQIKINSGMAYKKGSDGKYAFDYLSEINTLKSYLYGAKAPVFHLGKVEYADYLVNHFYDFAGAERIYQNSLLKIVAPELDSGSRILPDLVNNLAKFYETTERYKPAMEYYQNVLGLMDKHIGTQNMEYAEQLEKIAGLYYIAGDYKFADTTIGTAIEILKDIKETDSPVYMDALVTKAKIKTNLGFYDGALKDINRAQRIASRLDKFGAGLGENAEDAIGFVYLKTGNFKESEKILYSNLSTKMTYYPETSPELVATQLNLANLQLQNGNYAEAEVYARKASLITSKIFGDTSVKYAECLMMQQRIVSQLGDYDKAEKYLDDVIRIYNRKFTKSHIFLAEAYLNLALIKFYKKEEPKKVEEDLQKALNLVLKYFDESHPLYAEVIKNIARFYMNTGRVGEAETLLDKATDIYKEALGRKNLSLAEIYVLKAQLHLKQKKLRTVEGDYEKALKTYEKYLSKSHPSYISTLSQMAKYYYYAGNYTKALEIIAQTTQKYLEYIDKFFPSLSEREKLKFWSLIRNDFEFYNFLSIQYYRQDPTLLGKAFNYALITKSLLLNNSIKTKQNILNSGNKELVAKYNEYLLKKQKLSEVLSMSDDEMKLSGYNVQQLENEVTGIEKELSKESAAYGVSFDQKGTTWQQVRDSMKTNEAAVEIIRTHQFNLNGSDTAIYAALIVNKQSSVSPDLVVFKEGNLMESKYLKYYRNAIKYQQADEISFNAYWKPIHERVKKYKLVYVSPDGVFNQINLETLQPEENKFLIDAYELQLVNNFKDVVAAQSGKNVRKAGNTSALLVGAPTFYLQPEPKHNINDLPGTLEEVNSIDSLLISRDWKVEFRTDEKATESSVKKSKNPKLFHIATHGFFKEMDEQRSGDLVNEELASPLNRSGLLLSGAGDILVDDNTLNFNQKDGILTANEAMNLNLDQTDLVILSACETGLGDVQAGEGVYGLQRSFLVAGARTLVMSLFKVNDEVTQLMMKRFYKYWLETGNKHRSFILAKRDVKREYPEPNYWGAFVMIGKE